MAYSQGAVVEGDDLVGPRNTRPYVILSNKNHPFYGNEYIALVVSTTPRNSAFKLDSNTFQRGKLPKRSFVNPWNPVTMKDTAIKKHVASLTKSAVDDLADEVNNYIERNP